MIHGPCVPGKSLHGTEPETSLNECRMLLRSHLANHAATGERTCTSERARKPLEPVAWVGYDFLRRNLNTYPPRPSSWNWNSRNRPNSWGRAAVSAERAPRSGVAPIGSFAAACGLPSKRSSTRSSHSGFARSRNCKPRRRRATAAAAAIANCTPTSLFTPRPRRRRFAPPSSVRSPLSRSAQVGFPASRRVLRIPSGFRARACGCRCRGR